MMKTQIVLPDALLTELRRTVPHRKRSEFIAHAIERRLKALRLQKILRETAGCWTDDNHPELRTQADVNRFLGRFRSRLRKHA